MAKIWSLEDCVEIARERDGECLSDRYTNTTTKMVWKCKEGHRWSMTFNSVNRNGVWCPECVNIAKLKRCKEMAKNNGGRCLSSKYINSKERMLWECKKKHRWRAQQPKSAEADAYRKSMWVLRQICYGNVRTSILGKLLLTM